MIHRGIGSSVTRRIDGAARFLPLRGTVEAMLAVKRSKCHSAEGCGGGGGDEYEPCAECTDRTAWLMGQQAQAPFDRVDGDFAGE